MGLASRALAGPLGLLALALRSLWPCSPWSHQPRTSLRRLARSDRRLGQSIGGRPRRALADDPERGAVQTATERAAEAIEAAEKVFADEMGATLGLSPDAKVALIVKIAAAIEAAVAEERQQLT